MSKGLGDDPAEDAIAAMAIFGGVLTKVDDEHLELETPCVDWDVQALISHVVLGDASVPLVFAGDPLPVDAAVDVSILGPNPVATWRGTALAAIDALRAPGAMDVLVDHPTGPQLGSAVARFRLVDVLVHAWDLAAATGIEIEIPEELAEAVLDFLLPMFDSLRASGQFGEPVEPPPGAPAWQRMLGLLGRQPWSTS